ncbi:MAG TPA: site-2 protease family protein [Anaerolineaceae bacterium]
MDADFSYESLVSRYFMIEDITLGTAQQNFLVRYRGHLRVEDSAAAYDHLASLLAPQGVTPLFRQEGEQQVILLVPGKPAPKPSNPWINLGLFILTLFSVALSGALYGLENPLTGNLWQDMGMVFSRGWPFAASLLAILGAHEFGHYLVGRYNGVHVTLPYFIPFPFSPFGTMGAFINMKETPKNRRVLLDIGLAGPLSGLAVAIPVLILGLALSSIDRIPLTLPSGTSLQLEGNSILYLLLKYLMFGQLLPAPASFGSLPPALYWLQYFFTGRPYPLGGVDVMLHPVAWAGWAGILVTALNLIPAGQLDGGHAMYVLFGAKKMRRMLPVILVVLVVMGFIWNGWWLWAALIFWLGRAHAEPLDQITPLDARRKWLAILAILLFFLVFTPVPLNVLM